MEARLQRVIQQRGWDRAVAEYETYWRDQLRPAHDAVLAAASLAPGERVIDIACGTGMVTLPAARAVGPSGRVLATDISQRMIDDTSRRAGQGGPGNVDVRRCGAEDLAAESDAFDVALCSLGLMYVPQPADAIGEVGRALRPGGRAVWAVWGQRHNCGWAELFPIVDSRVSSDVCPMFFALGAPGGLARLVTLAGFIEVKEVRVTTELVYADSAAAIGAAFLGGPVALAHSRFDDETKASAYAEYMESIEPFRNGVGYRVPGEFVVVSGRLAHGHATPTGFPTTKPTNQPTKEYPR